MLRIISPTILVSVLLTAGCASTDATRGGGRSYDVDVNELMDHLDATLANMGIEIEDLATTDDGAFSVVARQTNAAVRGGSTTTSPAMHTLQITVRSTSPTSSSISVSVPPGDYGSVNAAQLRQRVLRALDRRVESSR